MYGDIAYGKEKDRKYRAEVHLYTSTRMNLPQSSGKRKEGETAAKPSFLALNRVEA